MNEPKNYEEQQAEHRERIAGMTAAYNTNAEARKPEELNVNIDELPEWIRNNPVLLMSEGFKAKKYGGTE